MADMAVAFDEKLKFLNKELVINLYTNLKS